MKRKSYSRRRTFKSFRKTGRKFHKRGKSKRIPSISISRGGMRL